MAQEFLRQPITGIDVSRQAPQFPLQSTGRWCEVWKPPAWFWNLTARPVRELASLCAGRGPCLASSQTVPKVAEISAHAFQNHPDSMLALCAAPPKWNRPHPLLMHHWRSGGAGCAAGTLTPP